eukprot:gene26918-35615_t
MIQVLVGDETGRCKHLKIRQSNSDEASESSFEVSCINNGYKGGKNSLAVQGLVRLFEDSQSPGRTVATVRADSSAELLHFDGCGRLVRHDSPAMVASPSSSGTPVLGAVSLGERAFLSYRADGLVSVHTVPAHDQGGSDAHTQKVRGPLAMNGCCATLTSSGASKVAFGGQENDLTLFDYGVDGGGGELKQVWMARNVSQDSLHLRVPVYVSAAAFIGEARSIEPASIPLSSSPPPSHYHTGEDRENIAVGTAYKQLRIYDPRAGTRPVKEIASKPGQVDYRITSVCWGGPSQSHSLFSGDTAGNLLLWDLPDGRFLASAGLDRCLRVYDVAVGQSTGSGSGSGSGSRSPPVVCSAYLHNRLTRCCFLPAGQGSHATGIDGEGEGEHSDGEGEEGEEGGGEDRLEELSLSQDEDDDEEEEEEEEEVAVQEEEDDDEEEDEEEPVGRGNGNGNGNGRGGGRSKAGDRHRGAATATAKKQRRR